MDSSVSAPRRRAFLGASLAGLAAATSQRVSGANERIRAGLIGLGSRGSNALAPAALALGVDLAAICDINTNAVDQMQTLLGKAGAPKAQSFGDYRQLLGRKDIDVVFVATPDHWHGPMTVDACRAGKDVYVEKPLAHTVEDGQAIVDAAAKTQRIVQVGLQQRSMKVYLDALEMIRAGEIGKIERCTMTWGRGGGGAAPADPEGPPPEGLNWDAFHGSAPKKPYRLSRYDNWRSYWEYGSGSITDLGVHIFDVARWFLSLDLPASSYGVGYRTERRNPEQVPDVFDLTWKYPSFLINYSNYREDMMNNFWGETGRISVNRAVLRVEKFQTRGKVEPKELRIVDPGFDNTTLSLFNKGNAAHVRNFLDAVRTRNQPSCPPKEAFLSTLACLMAARSVRTGKAYRWDGTRMAEI